jgi:type IV secretory pathway VirB4 component
MMESERGIIEGVTPSGDLVFLDWWSPQQRNANRLIVAHSGSGKSSKAKLDLIRTAQHDAAAGIQGQQIVIDPESEFVRSGIKALGGQWVRFAAGSPHQINPFDLQVDVLTETIRNAQALFDIMLADRTSQGPGTLKSEEKGLLDRVLYEAYREKGITADRQTHTLPPPLLRDIHRILKDTRCGKDTTDLSARLERFVSGSLAGQCRGGDAGVGPGYPSSRGPGDHG